MKTLIKTALCASALFIAMTATAGEFPQTIRAQTLSLLAGFERGMAEQVKRKELPQSAADCMVRGLEQRGPVYIETFFRGYFTGEELDALEDFYTSPSGQKFIQIDEFEQRKRRGQLTSKKEVPPKVVFEDTSRSVTFLGTSAGRKIDGMKAAMAADRQNFLVVIREVVRDCKASEKAPEPAAATQTDL